MTAVGMTCTFSLEFHGMIAFAGGFRSEANNSLPRLVLD